MKMKKLLITLLILASTGLCAFAEIDDYYEPSTEAKLQYNHGVDYYKLGQYDRAMASFRQAITLDPNYIDAYYNLGTILEYLKQDDAALAVFKQIIVRNPNDYESVYKAAQLSNKLGQPVKAKAYLSLIPPESSAYAKAQAAVKEMSTNVQQQAKTEVSQTSAVQEEPKTPATPVVQETPKIPETNGMYNNITSPTGVTTDNKGNLYVACFSDNMVYKITPDEKRIVYVKDSRINGPIALASDDNGNIYVSNYNSNNVVKISPTGALTVQVSNIQKPYGLHVKGDLLFVSSQGSNSVLRYKL